MDEVLVGVVIGIVFTVASSLYIFGDDLKSANNQVDLIKECKKDLPRSSTCELYAKEKENK